MTAVKLNQNLFTGTRDISAVRFVYGAVYGLIAGVAFASATWGWDGYLLSQTHAFMPWLKFTLGVVLCGLAGSLTGWATIRYERWWVAFLSWAGLAFVFAGLTIILPLQISPLVSKWYQPQLREFIQYLAFNEVGSRFLLAFMWVVIFVAIAGVLESVLVESTIFASSFIGRTSPAILCIAILIACGVIVDGLNNEPLRRATINMDATIQFVLDHRGQEVDKAKSRANHAGTLRVFTDDLSTSRELLIGGYDAYLGEVNILVKFDELLLRCTVLYGQPAFCAPPEQE